MPDAHAVRHHLLGLFVAFHVAAVALGSLPAPVSAVNRSSWNDPVVAAELDAWFETVSALGLSTDRKAFEDDLYDIAVGAVRARHLLLTPVRHYYHTTGTTQGWQMFVAPMTRPATLRVDGRSSANDDWTALYVRHSETHRWYADQLESSRVRPITFRLAWPHYRRPYERFARYLAAQAAADHPELVEVQVSWERRTTPSPYASNRNPTAKQERAVVFELGADGP